jgi:hypothetical protein
MFESNTMLYTSILARHPSLFHVQRKRAEGLDISPP